VIAPAQADDLIRQRVKPLPVESLPLAQCTGAVLREDIYAERDQPPFNRVAMDGIAVDSQAVNAGARRLPVQAMQAAGDPPLTLASPRSCIEVMTGAVLPAGCDSIVPVEDITINDGVAELGSQVQPEPGRHVHPQGSDTRQGSLLLRSGQRLGSTQIAIAASAGKARIQVSSQPMLAVISTGNELVEPGEPILPHQVRRSNAYALIAALREHGFQRVADDHIRDDAAELTQRLSFHLTTHDVVILSGGVSMGKLDLVPRTLEALGVDPVFHKVAQRPGKPLWFGVTPSGTLVFGLPGNPVSASVCLIRFVLPALLASQGQAPAVPRQLALASPVTVATALTQFLPVQIELDEESRAWARTRPTNSSGDFLALEGTDGFVELPPGPRTYARGFLARLYCW
jgi:molybdopterin molybdotransferase